MRFLQKVSFVTLAVFVSASTPAADNRSAPVLVRAAVSGDTLDIATVGHVRLAGIRAPRIARFAGGSEPYAEDARRRLASATVNRWVRLERTRGHAGGRASVYVWTEDGVLLNALMLREGLAQLATAVDPARSAQLAAAEHEARSARRGLWSGGSGTAREPEAVIRQPKPPR